MNMTHPDTLTIEKFTSKTNDESYINAAMLDDEIVLAYINSDKDFVFDWMEYTRELAMSGYEPTAEEWELVKNIPEEDQYNLCYTINWINLDRGHFANWLNEI